MRRRISPEPRPCHRAQFPRASCRCRHAIGMSSTQDSRFYVKLGKDGGNQMLWAFHSIRSGWPTYRVHRRLLQSPTVPFEHRLPNASSSKNGHNHGSSCINQECSGPASGTIATSVASFMAASSTALLYRSWSVCPLVSTHFLADHVVYLIGENSNIAIGDVRKSRCKTNKIV